MEEQLTLNSYREQNQTDFLTSTRSMQVSVVLPCLNESQTLSACIRSAISGLECGGFHGEIIVADNGSTDESKNIAMGEGAIVVDVKSRGYGAAVLGGINAATGEYVIMADADGSYDFREIPRFMDKLSQGYDLVIGNRFAGCIQVGAMPFHHRYLGNPILSGIGRALFRPNCRDFHCGLRGFNRESICALKLSCKGMEFASEMVAKATLKHLRICEVPITLYPDGRGRQSHLRCCRDGIRHLYTLFSIRIRKVKS